MPAISHRRKRIVQACQALLALAAAASCIGCNAQFGNACALDLTPLHRITSFQGLPQSPRLPLRHAIHGRLLTAPHLRHTA